MATTDVSAVVVPSIFTPYVQQLTEAKTALIESGALVRDGALDLLLAGGGLLYDVPSWKDLADDADNVSSDEAIGANDVAPKATGSATEIAVRLSRNQQWQTSDLAGDLAGSDPAASIANRVAYYRAQKLQAAFVATLNGIFANNDAATPGGTGVRYDMTYDASGSTFVDGTTNFTTENFINAALTMGDSMGNLSLVMVHSVVYARMQINNLIDFIPDSRGETNIATFLGRRVIVDDHMPVTSNVYDTWLFGAGSVRLGMGNPKVPTEVYRDPRAGNGGGAEILAHRWQLVIHPVGNAFVGTTSKGGPSNASSSNNLAAAASWQRRFVERKQIRIARLKTREA